MYQNLIQKQSRIVVIGMGYVGLPLAIYFDKKNITTIGFDIDKKKVNLLNQGIDNTNEVSEDMLKSSSVAFHSDENCLNSNQNTCFIITVPTPVNEHKQPVLDPVLSASKTVGKYIKKGDYVIYESTVYPGCTEEECISVIERNSNLTRKKDFMFGYSPERINPGDKTRNVQSINKIVSACCSTGLENIKKIYELVVTKADVFPAKSIRIAEASKIIENTQRDINIACINELTIVLDKLGIQMHDVLECTQTKWNALPFFPGLVGGHCIGVDPYYLIQKSIEQGYEPKISNTSRLVNEGMPKFISDKIESRIKQNIPSKDKYNTLILGFSFKENVSDTRNTKVKDLVDNIARFSEVTICDPEVDMAYFKEIKCNALSLDDVLKSQQKYDIIVLATPHDKILQQIQQIHTLLTDSNLGIFFDVYKKYKGKPVTNYMYL